MNTRQSGAHRQLIEKEDKVRATWIRENMKMLRKSRPQDFNPEIYQAYGIHNNERVYLQRPEKTEQTISLLSQGMGPPPRSLFGPSKVRRSITPSVKRRGPRPREDGRAQSSQAQWRPRPRENRRHSRVQQQPEEGWGRTTPVDVSVPGSMVRGGDWAHTMDAKAEQMQSEYMREPDKEPKYQSMAEIEQYQDYMKRIQEAPASSAPALAFASVLSSRKEAGEAPPTTSTRKSNLELQKELLEEFYPGKKPNQHGHTLLPEYDAITEAAGLGAGPKHRHYFRYLSHYKPKPDKEFNISASSADKLPYKSKGCKKPQASGMGYGQRHKYYNTYMSATRVGDLPEHTRPVNMELLNKF